MSEFLSLAQRRRSIRHYTNQPVEREKTEQMLQAALMSPSAKRLRPWQFVVVEDKQVIERLAACKQYGSQMLLEAPLAIVVAVDASLTDTWQCDAAIAAEHLLLAAEDLGLGACWVHVCERENAEQTVRELTGIPDSLRVLCIISVGYKNEERRIYELDKLPYEKIHYGKY